MVRIRTSTPLPALDPESNGEFVSTKVPLLFGNLGKWPYVELEPIMTLKTEDMN